MLDGKVRRCYTVRMNKMNNPAEYDSSYSPAEVFEIVEITDLCEHIDFVIAGIPNCYACADEGVILDEEVYCDCDAGEERCESDAWLVGEDYWATHNK